MLLAESPLPPSADLGGEAGGTGEWERAAVGNEQSLRVGRRFWSSFAVPLEPPQACPGTALRQPYRPREGRRGLWQPGLSSTGSTRKRVALWGEDVKPVLEQTGVFYLQPPL